MPDTLAMAVLAMAVAVAVAITLLPQSTVGMVSAQVLHLAVTMTGSICVARPGSGPEASAGFSAVKPTDRDCVPRPVRDVTALLHRPKV